MSSMFKMKVGFKRKTITSVKKHIFCFLLAGLWAVINTAGVCCRGRLEAQDVALWDVMLKLNVVGTLRAARTFIPLLKNTRGESF